MNKLIVIAMLFAATAACSEKVKKVKIADPDAKKVAQLQQLYDDMLRQAEDIRDPVTGWLDVKGCDGMIWAGRYASAPGVNEVDILAAENPEQPGRFHRRPAPYCWNEDEGDVGSKSTWSRDMAVCGLFVYAWEREDLQALERHAAYGKQENWKMGKPIADGRVLYTPSVIGLLYQLIFGLGGEDNASRAWPSIYTAGLDDFQAHLQVCSIWLRGEVAETYGDADAVPAKPEDGASLTSVSTTMFERLQEHHERVPGDPFYAYVHGLYNGDMMPAVEACLDGTVGGYVRSSYQEDAELAHRIFACGKTLQSLGKL